MTLPISARCLLSVRTAPSWTIISAATLAIAAMAATGASAQSITSLGVPAGASASGANAVSGDGSRVAASVDMFGAHRWTSAGFTSIGSLPGAYAMSADDISTDGQTIAGSAFIDVPEETARAIRWTAGGGLQDLGTLPGGVASFGSGLSGDGSVITGASFDADFNTSAFRWTSAGGMQPLGSVPGGTGSEGRRVSHDGSTIIGIAFTADGDRAFRWTSAGGMQRLPTLLPTDGASSAFGVNGDGSVIAGFSGNSAVIWTNGVAQDLGRLPGAESAIAYTLSNDGSLVGGYSFFSQGVRATLWSQALGLVDLNTYLPTLGIDLTGWHLQYTRDISLDGTTIVGEGRFNGEMRGWVVTIPAPGTSGAIALAGVMAARRRRR
jgi:probable HAF family extracellular repeat protein